MKKRLLSACTALLCLAQIPALSVSAVSMEEAAWNVFPNYSYTETADGRAFCEDLGFRMQGFLVITDGTELTAEHLGTLPDSEWYDWTLTELDFVPSAIGCDGVRCYQVYPKKKAGYAEYESLPHPVFAQCGKQLMLENPCITYAGELECLVDGYVQWAGEFMPLLAGGAILPETLERLAADETYQAAMDFYTSWQAGAAGDYEALQYAETMAQTLFPKFEDGCMLMLPKHDFLPERDTASYRTADCWENAGDYGKDGTVDAADASALLTYAAQISAGLTQGTQDVTDRMDLNADGLVNSRDAANILRYASAAGSGYTGTIVEFVR